MKTLKETVYEFIQNDNIRSEIKQIFKPFGVIIYNEIYFYILLILVYCSLLFLAVLGTLFYLINIHKKLSRFNVSRFNVSEFNVSELNVSDNNI
jgi:hypothetical protein